MGLAIASIKKRWTELCRIRQRKLTARNVDEYYVSDVRDLLRMNEALMKTCCQLNIKLHEATNTPVKQFEVYWRNYDNAVENLLGNNIQPPPPTKPILKPDG